MDTQPQSPGAPPDNAALETRASTAILTWDLAKPATQEGRLSRGGHGHGAAGEPGGRRPAFRGCHRHG